MGKVSKEAHERYTDKTYNFYTVKLRKAEDADLIARLEALKATGLSAASAIRNLMEIGAQALKKEEDKMKTIIKLTQDAYAAGGYRRMATEDGKDSIHALSGEWYEAWAVDDAGRKYFVAWELREDYDPNSDEGDEGNACDWNSPYYVEDEDGRNVTEKVIIKP